MSTPTAKGRPRQIATEDQIKHLVILKALCCSVSHIAAETQLNRRAVDRTIGEAAVQERIAAMKAYFAELGGAQ